jgi:AraC-like DNA-binding protein
VFVDPSLDPDFVDECARLRADTPMACVVLYTTLEPRSIKRCMTLAAAGVEEIVFAGFDDARERLLRLIEDIETRAPVSQVGSMLDALFDGVPGQLRAAIDTLFRDPGRFHCMEDVARESGISTRSVFRWLKRRGIRSGRRLVAAAKLVAAYRLLARDGRSARDVARRLGYPSVDQLSLHLNELTMWTWREVKLGVTMESFCDAIRVGVTSSRARPKRRLSKVHR